MAGLMDQFGQVIASIAAQPAVRVVVTGAAVFIVWLAAALWVYQDSRRHHASPIAPYRHRGRSSSPRRCYSRWP